MELDGSYGSDDILVNSLRDNPILLQFYLQEKLVNDVGSMVRAYDRYLKYFDGKFIYLSEFYDKNDLEHLQVKNNDNNDNNDISVEYFITNKFKYIYKECEDEITHFIGDNIEFYILFNPGSGYNYDCCASITLYYKTI
jgi:hypothetical protein